jgi:hypothetical protein
MREEVLFISLFYAPFLFAISSRPTKLRPQSSALKLPDHPVAALERDVCASARSRPVCRSEIHSVLTYRERDSPAPFFHIKFISKYLEQWDRGIPYNFTAGSKGARIGRRAAPSQLNLNHRRETTGEVEGFMLLTLSLKNGWIDGCRCENCASTRFCCR